MKVKELVVGQKEAHPKLEQRLFQIAEEQGTVVTKVKNGDSWRYKDYVFHVLAPGGQEEKENERSIVLYSELGEYKWLFTGDLEEEGEKVLLRNYEGLEVDVLKLGYHGSKTSTTEEFLRELQPKVGVISVGENNRYKHPSPDVVDRMVESGMQIFRTDKHGSISYDFKKNRGTFSTILPYDASKE